MGSITQHSTLAVVVEAAVAIAEDRETAGAKRVGADHQWLVLFVQIGAKGPDNLAGLFVDDEDQIHLAGAHQEIAGPESLIAAVEPGIGRERLPEPSSGG